jgi:hypothetical protein
MFPGQHRYYRLDLKPEVIKQDRITFQRKALHNWSPDRVFAEDDLYTTKWGRNFKYRNRTLLFRAT